MKKFLILTFFLSSLHAMEVEKQLELSFSLKCLCSLVGYHKATATMTRNSQHEVEEHTISIPQSSITIVDKEHNKIYKKNTYEFIQEFYKAIPEEIGKHCTQCALTDLLNTPNARSHAARAYALYKTLSGHGNSISSVILNQKEKKLFSGSLDNTIMCWNTDAHASTYALTGHSGYITTFYQGPEPHLLLSGSHDNTIKCWNTKTEDCLFTLENKHDNGICALAWDTTTNTIHSASFDQNICCYNVKTKEYIPTPFERDESFVSSFLFNQGTTTIAGLWDQTIKFQNPTNRTIISAHREHITCLYKQNNAEIVYSGSQDGSIVAWNPKTQTELKKYTGHTGPVLTLHFDYSNNLLISGSKEGTIKIWNPDTEACLHTLIGHSDGVAALAHDTNTSIIYSGSYDATINAWKSPINYSRTLQHANHLADLILVEHSINTSPVLQK